MFVSDKKVQGWAPYIPMLFGWDWNPQSYSREGSGLLGINASKFIGCFPVHAGAHQGSYPCDTSDAVRRRTCSKHREVGRDKIRRRV